MSKTKLRYRWDRRHGDFVAEGPNGPDRALLFHYIGFRWLRPTPLGQTVEELSLIEELERRGYDTRTLRISVEKHQDHDETQTGPNSDASS